jgi:hypothetical protein
LLRGWPALATKREVLAQAFRLPNGVSDRQTLTSRRMKLTAAGDDQLKAVAAQGVATFMSRHGPEDMDRG